MRNYIQEIVASCIQHPGALLLVGLGCRKLPTKDDQDQGLGYSCKCEVKSGEGTGEGEYEPK